jgi:membrane-associated phospholipid phosphatase
MNWRSAKISALLSLLFLVVYGTTNWLASLRADVRGFPFAWERHIPFVPLMIIPYMSIDLFFVAAPFFCADARQRRTLARQLAAAILIAGLCFVLLPLRFTFERPHVDGWLGAIFNNFRTMDRPFNQFPSLHIALGVILAAHYWRRLRGIIGVTVLIWFALILLSALLTYQHHMIDIIGGSVLAIICLHLFQDEPLRQVAAGSTRIGACYLAAALLLSLGAFAAGPWTWLLLYPAISCGMIASAYLGIGPGIYRKASGRLPLTTRLLLFPVHVGHQLSWIHYARQCRAWDPLTDRLWIGRRLGTSDAKRAVAAGVTAVLDLTVEFAEAPPLLNVTYRQLPLLDLTAPTVEQMKDAVEWIREQGARGVVYLHCKAGYSRTAAIASAFLLASGQADSSDEAMKLLRLARPSIVIRPEAAAAIRAFEQSLAAKRSFAASTKC